MNTNGRPGVARDAGKFFSLLDERLTVGTEGYSPRLLQKIEYAGGNEPSFRVASMALEQLAELPISARHVERITERLGRERAAQRDAEVAALKAGQMESRYREPPQVAAIHLDAGKLQLRADDGRPGVRDPHWGDTKVACFQTYTPLSGTLDPQPDPPAVFLDPPRVMRLCQEMERVRSQPAEPPGGGQKDKGVGSLLVEQEASVERPERLLRTAVATTQSTEPFGWMVAAEASKRGFYQASRKAVVGDGGNWIGPLADLHFPGWVQVLDFLHLLVHLYAAATAAHRGTAKEAWRLYERLVRRAWSGQVKAVVALLQAEVERLGEPPPQARYDDPSRVVALTLNYVKTNAYRMDYAQYRREGLPISSALVESLIKQFNYRVKGT
ncbi:MAG: hypothetical protein KAV82_16500, partial [Phycisphaerae bacterium]|nr:hypothetical protein [Phycisphaerae bacterium]